MGKISDFFGKLKKIKHIEIIACAVLMAIALFVYFACASCSEKKTDSSPDISGLDYCTAMQYRLEKIVSEIEGVGDASVVINWDRSVATSFGGGTSENPKATGVIVVCVGGDSTKVKLDVMYAVSTLLNLSIEKIIVYPKSI